jgi:lysophospholipase L1-like esterase
MNHEDTKNTKKNSPASFLSLCSLCLGGSHCFSPRPQHLCVRLVSVLIFALLCAFSWLSNSTALAQKAVERGASDLDADRFESEIADFEKWDHQNAFPRDGILFVGSSTIRLWQTADAFPGLPVINRGFGGSTIADVNHFADRMVFKYEPRLIVFYAGDNDIAAGRTPERVFNDFQTFAASVHDRLPATPIIFLGIKPSVARWKLWPQMQEVNARVKELTRENKKLIYVDTAPAMLGDDGQPRKDLLRDDGLHLSDKGYAAWTKVLAPQLHTESSHR